MRRSAVGFDLDHMVAKEMSKLGAKARKLPASSGIVALAPYLNWLSEMHGAVTPTNSYSIFVTDSQESPYALSFKMGDDEQVWLFSEPPAKATLGVQLQDKRSLRRKTLWDQGIITFADEPQESFRRGWLKFELAGEKICGGFMLVRTTSIGKGLNRLKAWRLRRLEDAHQEVANNAAPTNFLWPETKTGRAELAEYYAQAAPLAAPFFKNRSFTLLKGPSGVTGGLFFEHDPDGQLATVEHFKTIAELPALEVHAMNFLTDQPQLPDWMVLELEAPDDESSVQLLMVAGAAHELLAEMSLKAMWKLSGHRGLHLMIPIKRLYETVVVFDFAKMIAEMIYERVPTLSTIKLPQHLHSRRILIDYHRNHYHQSIVAPFSPRVLSRPTISLPLTWQEIKAVTKLPVYDIGISAEKLKESGEILSAAMAHPNDLELAFVHIERHSRQVL